MPLQKGYQKRPLNGCARRSWVGNSPWSSELPTVTLRMRGIVKGVDYITLGYGMMVSTEVFKSRS
jgi:hypothetical protein